MSDTAIDLATQTILNARAQRLLHAQHEGQQEEVLWCACFRLGDERYAIPLPSMLAVLPLKAVTPVPLSPNQVLGMLRFQGSLIAAMSLPSLLGGKAVHGDPVALIVVESDDGRRVALDCEEIPVVVGIHQSELLGTKRDQRGAVSEVNDEAGMPVHYLNVTLLLNDGGFDGA